MQETGNVLWCCSHLLKVIFCGIIRPDSVVCSGGGAQVLQALVISMRKLYFLVLLSVII